MTLRDLMHPHFLSDSYSISYIIDRNQFAEKHLNDNFIVYRLNLERLLASDDAKLNDTFLVPFDHQWHCQCPFYTLHTCVFPTPNNLSSNLINIWNHECKQHCGNIPLRSRDTRPFHVNAVRITAGQKGATFSDQSAHLISYKHTYI